MNPPKGSKPFDLAAALAGAPVVTRDGRPVYRLVYDTGHAQPLSISGNDGTTLRYRADGIFFKDKTPESAFDLFMVQQTKKGWLNLYFSDSVAVAGSVHSTQASAEQWGDMTDYLKTVEVEIPV